MKNWFKKNWSLVVFAATVIVDMQFQILEAVTDSPKAVAVVRVLGLVALAVVNFNRLNSTSQTKSSTGIGGRPDDRNPKKP